MSIGRALILVLAALAWPGLVVAHFVSITVDPERGTPAVLKEYAQNVGANLAGWAFLTSTPEGILGRNPPVWRLRVENGRRRRRSHVPHPAYRPARHSARTIPRSALRSGGVPA